MKKAEKEISNATFIPDMFENEISTFVKVNGKIYTNYIITSHAKLYRCDDDGMEITYTRLKGTVSMYGYREVSLELDGKMHHCRMCRLVAEAFVPNPYNKPQVNHIDTNRLNDYYTNLEWTTGRENLEHSYEFGFREASKENTYKSLYPERVIYQICEELERHDSDPNIKIKEIAKKYGVSRSLVSDLHMKRRHKNITSQFNYTSPRKELYDENLIYAICADIEEDKMLLKDVAKKHNVKPSLVQELRAGNAIEISWKSLISHISNDQYREN